VSYPFATVEEVKQQLEPNKEKMDLEIKLYLGSKVTLNFVNLDHFDRVWKKLADILSPQSDLNQLKDEAFAADSYETYQAILTEGLRKLHQKKGYQYAEVTIQTHK